MGSLGNRPRRRWAGAWPFAAMVLGIGLAGAPARAQLVAMLAVDAAAQKDMLASTYSDLANGLSKAAGQSVRVDRSSNFADVLRSTRTGEYDIYVVPGHVAASALTHGYNLAAADKPDTFVLVTKPGVGSVKQLKGRKIYLAQQDSIHSYMAKGLLNEAGLSLSELSDVQYRTTAGAGLVAVSLGVVDATVTRRSEYQEWTKSQPAPLAVLLESKPVPGGMAMLVKKNVAEPQRERLAQWATGPQFGVGRLAPVTEATTVNYKYLGGLGHFTPVNLPGATRVGAVEVADLIKQGAMLVDVRSEKEYAAKRIVGAVLAPYVEKSVKDISFNAAADDFSAVLRLDKAKPVIFACNGAECWKSYKASRFALEQKFQKVYWFRGGLPEWEESGLPLAKN